MANRELAEQIAKAYPRGRRVRDACFAKPLPQQESLLAVLRYDGETGELTWLPRSDDMLPRNKSWNARHAGRPALAYIANGGYRCGFVFGGKYQAHRIIWKLAYGEEPQAIDHINGDKTDNRLANLRSVPQSENCRNKPRRADNTSGITGVNRNKGRWIAQIKANGRRITLGRFDRLEDAAACRAAAEIAYGYHENHGRAV
jgi:hypothetical protein